MDFIGAFEKKPKKKKPSPVTKVQVLIQSECPLLCPGPCRVQNVSGGREQKFSEFLLTFDFWILSLSLVPSHQVYELVTQTVTCCCDLWRSPDLMLRTTVLETTVVKVVGTSDECTFTQVLYFKYNSKVLCSSIFCYTFTQLHFGR